MAKKPKPKNRALNHWAEQQRLNRILAAPNGCPRKCGEANDSAGSGNDRNCEDTTQGDRPAAVVKVPPPEYPPRS